MDLNNISFPPQLIASLYHHSLVEGGAAEKPAAEPVAFLGKGGKGILVVVNHPSVPYLPDAELAFITKVLLACQLSLADVAIVNWAKMPAQNADKLVQQFHPQNVLLFDVPPDSFGLPPGALPFAVQQVAEIKFVAAPALHQIEKTKEAKGQLWMALKTLFDL